MYCLDMLTEILDCDTLCVFVKPFEAFKGNTRETEAKPSLCL